MADCNPFWMGKCNDFHIQGINEVVLVYLTIMNMRFVLKSILFIFNGDNGL